MASTHWGKIFKHANGTPVVGKGNNHFQLVGVTGSDTDGNSFYLTESTTIKGYYYGEVTETGRYWVYRGGTKDENLSGVNGITIVCA